MEKGPFATSYHWLGSLLTGPLNSRGTARRSQGNDGPKKFHPAGAWPSPLVRNPGKPTSLARDPFRSLPPSELTYFGLSVVGEIRRAIRTLYPTTLFRHCSLKSMQDPGGLTSRKLTILILLSCPRRFNQGPGRKRMFNFPARLAITRVLGAHRRQVPIRCLLLRWKARKSSCGWHP